MESRRNVKGITKKALNAYFRARIKEELCTGYHSFTPREKDRLDFIYQKYVDRKCDQNAAPLTGRELYDLIWMQYFYGLDRGLRAGATYMLEYLMENDLITRTGGGGKNGGHSFNSDRENLPGGSKGIHEGIQSEL